MANRLMRYNLGTAWKGRQLNLRFLDTLHKMGVKSSQPIHKTRFWDED